MFTLSRKTVRRISALALSAMVATLSALWWPPERNLPWLDPILTPLQRAEWFGYDTMFHWRGVQPGEVDRRIAIVGFSRQTEGLLEPGKSHEWPPPRRFHAGVIDNLVKDGAKVIVFDVLMSKPSLHGVADDRALDAALNRAGRCILACRIDRDSTASGDLTTARKNMVDPYHNDEQGIDFERNATEAFVDIPTDRDEVVRRIYPLQKFQGEWLPSLSAAAFLKLTGRKIEDSRLTPTEINVGGQIVPRTGPTIIDPVDPENAMPTSYIDFPAGASTFPIYRYEDVYTGQFKPKTFQGKVVFIGVTGLELTAAESDKFRTAYSQYTPEAAGGAVTRDVYGVVVQGQMLNALLRERFIYQAPAWLTWVVVFLASCLTTYAVRSSLTWRGPVLLALSLTAYIVFVFSLFLNQQTYVPWVFPGVLLLGSAAGVAWFERGQMKKMWAGTVSPAYMEVLLREGYEAKPRRYEATVIFGDIRGFTTFSESKTPEMVIELLDKHLEKLVDILFTEEGTIDKFLGDGIMAVFGAPKAQSDAAVRAVRACWKMRLAALEPVLDEKGGQHVLATGFGIATGPLVAGHVGSKALSSYTLIGDRVNLAARLQAVTGEPDVIIDGATYELVKAHVEVEYLGERPMKGKAEPVACFKVTEWKD
jgi:adenylate cyclase